MGKDIVAGGRNVAHKHRKGPKTDNVYIRLLVKLYEFLVRRTGSEFCRAVLKRLIMSRTNRPAMGLARIQRFMAPKAGAEDRSKKIAVIVGSVTDDVRLTGFEFPAMTICALRVTEGARARIEAAGGKVMTLDQLAQVAPTGEGTVLMRGRRTTRESAKHFGTPGQIGSTAVPFVRSKGNKFEQARLRRSKPRTKVKAIKK